MGVSLPFECPGGHQLRDQDQDLVTLDVALPGVVETNDVGMLQTLQHLDLLLETMALLCGQTARLKEQQLTIIYMYTYIYVVPVYGSHPCVNIDIYIYINICIYIYVYNI